MRHGLNVRVLGDRAAVHAAEVSLVHLEIGVQVALLHLQGLQLTEKQTAET